MSRNGTAKFCPRTHISYQRSQIFPVCSVLTQAAPHFEPGADCSELYIAMVLFLNKVDMFMTSIYLFVVPGFFSSVCILVVSLPGPSSSKPLFDCRLSVNSRARYTAMGTVTTKTYSGPGFSLRHVLEKVTFGMLTTRTEKWHFFIISRWDFLTKENNLQTKKLGGLAWRNGRLPLVKPWKQNKKNQTTTFHMYSVNLASKLSSSSSFSIFCPCVTVSTVSVTHNSPRNKILELNILFPPLCFPNIKKKKKKAYSLSSSGAYL